MILGHHSDGSAAKLDLDRLIESRLLLQANSGGGKSWAIRRLCEQTYGKVQQIVIDVEDEFHTLREKFDYVLANNVGGDCPADPRSAAMLAKRLLELRASAVIGIYELKAHDRIRFVRLFLEALVNAPRELWHPVLVVVDEAHIFCPQTGEAESAGAVIDLMTRGRKRGFCGVLATQRISKLHKDAAAEANNKLIGRAAQDVDMKRAADELGITSREDMQKLRRLAAGEFFCFGPAMQYEVRQIKVGPVETTHPKAGQRAILPPAPRGEVQKMLAQLQDIPRQAQEEAQTVEALKAEVRELKRQRPAPAVSVSAEALIAAEKRGAQKAEAAGREINTRLAKALNLANGLILKISSMAQPVPVPDVATKGPQITIHGNPGRKTMDAIGKMAKAATESSINGLSPGPAIFDDLQRGGVAQRILDALAELEQLGARQPQRELVAFLAGYSNLNSKGFVNALGSLRSNGEIEYPTSGTVTLTDAGHGHANPPDRPRTSEELQQRIIRMLGGASGRILEPLIQSYPEKMDRTDVAERAGYTNLNSKGFVNAIGRLRTLGFVDYPDRGSIVACPVLFLNAVEALL